MNNGPMKRRLRCAYSVTTCSNGNDWSYVRFKGQNSGVFSCYRTFGLAFTRISSVDIRRKSARNGYLALLIQHNYTMLVSFPEAVAGKKKDRPENVLQSFSGPFTFNLTGTVSAKDIACIYLIFYVVEAAIITIGDDGIWRLWSCQGCAVRLPKKVSDLQRRFIDDYFRSFSFYAFHHALNTTLSVVVWMWCRPNGTLNATCFLLFCIMSPW